MKKKWGDKVTTFAEKLTFRDPQDSSAWVWIALGLAVLVGAALLIFR